MHSPGYSWVLPPVIVVACLQPCDDGQQLTLPAPTGFSISDHIQDEQEGFLDLFFGDVDLLVQHPTHGSEHFLEVRLLVFREFSRKCASTEFLQKRC